MILAIEKRKSVRTYYDKPLSMSDQLALKKALKTIEKHTTPYNTKPRFFYQENAHQSSEDAKRIGTYGFVKNAPAFIGGISHNTFESMVDFGYLFEKIVLWATKNNIDSVWLGGTFKRQPFNDLLKEKEVIPAIAAVGYGAETKTLREKLIRSQVKADERKPFETLFYSNSLETPIEHSKNNPHRYFIPLELVRLGPSASNKQPWRVIIQGDDAHFYLKRTPKYATGLKIDIQAIDMGIALAHFEVGLIHLNMKYQMVQCKDIPTDDALEYVISFKIKTQPST